MQKYILRRCIKRIEKREIEAVDWNEAMDKLKKFKAEPVPPDCVLDDNGTAEYIGDKG